MKIIKTADPFFEEEDISEILIKTKRFLQGDGMLSMGKNVQEFENNFSSYIGCKGSVATNSCTSALEVALLSLGVGPGDEVIVPVQTFIASGSCILRTGAKPVFCEINNNFLLDFESLKNKITESTKSVILVHYAGLLHEDIEEIKSYLGSRKIYLIEDAAHAPGASIDNKKAGNFGDLACFSFFSTKNMTTGEGGMITSNDGILLKKCSSIRNRGLDIDSDQEIFTVLGGNYRMTEFQALLGIYQLKRLDAINLHRNKIAKIYIKNLEETRIGGYLELPDINQNIMHAYWRFWVRLEDNIDRQDVKAHLATHAIPSDWAYSPLLHLQPLFKNTLSIHEGLMPKSEKLASQHICLPIHSKITEEDAEFISKTMSDYLLNIHES